jgi:hypothetical protein
MNLAVRKYPAIYCDLAPKVGGIKAPEKQNWKKNGLACPVCQGRSRESEVEERVSRDWEAVAVEL